MIKVMKRKTRRIIAAAIAIIFVIEALMLAVTSIVLQ